MVSYYTTCMFFTPALTGGLSLESKWQQTYSGLLDSSQYSGRSQQCCSLNGLHSSFNVQLLQSPFQTFGDRSKSTNYNRYHRHFHVPQLGSLSRSKYLSFFSFSIIIIIIIIYPWEFFTSALAADSLSWEFEWQQVSSSLQDSSQ